MTPFPYPVGTRVSGANCVGEAFSGTVTELRGAFSVVLDGLYITPNELIHTAEGVVEVAPEPVAASDQLSML